MLTSTAVGLNEFCCDSSGNCLRLTKNTLAHFSKKRRSSVSDAGHLSFDCTSSPDKLESEKLLHAEPEASDATPAKKSMRFNHFMDFYTTESNYVGILDTILNVG